MAIASTHSRHATTTDQLAGLDRRVRRELAAWLAQNRANVAAAWALRHGGQTPLRERVTDELGDWGAYERRYVIPLLKILEHGIARGRRDLCQVYVAERGRFLRHGFDDEQLAELAAADAADIADRLPEAGGLKDAGESLLAWLHEPLIRPSQPDVVRIAMVGDCLLTEIATFLEPAVRLSGGDVALRRYYFSAGTGISLSAADLLGALAEEPVDLVSLSFMSYDGVPLFRRIFRGAGDLSDVEQREAIDQLTFMAADYIAEVREVTDVPILLHGACGIPLTKVRKRLPFLPPMSRARRTVVAELSEKFRELSEAHPNVVFVDEQGAVRAAGIRRANTRIIPRSATQDAMFHTRALGSILAAEYEDVISAYRHLAKCKVLLVDFDNTLWRGVMAEGAVEHDVDGQRLLLELKRAGILLVSVSKNDPASIRWDEMQLSPDDFVLHKVSWAPKPQAIEEVAQALELGLDSFVLLDDNPVERELVAMHLPEVKSIDPTESAWRWLRLTRAFPNTRETEEATRRTEMYREAAARRQIMSDGIDLRQMLSQLGLEVEFWRARTGDMGRLHELLSRTNQFNTTTLRLTQAELLEFANRPDSAVFCASLKDKFGSLGLVGAVLASCRDGVLAYENVVMSCRAMGFGLEHLLLRATADAFPDASTAIGRFVPTARNGPCSTLFADGGFTAAGGSFFVDLRQIELPAIPGWLSTTINV